MYLPTLPGLTRIIHHFWRTARAVNSTHYEEAVMANHDDNFKDDSGILPIILGIVILVGMSALPATIGWIQAFGS